MAGSKSDNRLWKLLKLRASCKLLHTCNIVFAVRTFSRFMARGGTCDTTSGFRRWRKTLSADGSTLFPHPFSEGSFAAEPSRKIAPTKML